MPLDKSGKFHNSTQRAMFADRGGAPRGLGVGKEKPAFGGEPKVAGNEEAGEGGEHSQLHDHGDGSFHTMTSDGQQTEHPHITHALAHLAGHHSPENMHSVIQHHDDGTSTSSHHDGTEVSGPHEHENVEEMKEHLHGFANSFGNFADEKRKEKY